VWLLDEPSVSLDVKSVKILADVVDEHIQSGGIAIAATHVPLGFNFSQTMKL
jgi:heme exporter protein A